MGRAWHELRALGWVEGQNIIIESRSAEGKPERLPALAAELVQRQVDVLVTFPLLAAQAAKHATTTIPIVMINAADPVGTGLVASLARPGGNITGLSSMDTDLSGKRLALLKEAVPTLSRVAVIWNATDRAILATIYGYFTDPYDFEKCAAFIWAMEASSVDYEVTRRNVDGGRDAISVP